MKLKVIDVKETLDAETLEKSSSFLFIDEHGAEYRAHILGGVHDFDTVKRWYNLHLAFLSMSKDVRDVWIVISDPIVYISPTRELAPSNQFSIEVRLRPWTTKPTTAPDERPRKDVNG